MPLLGVWVKGMRSSYLSSILAQGTERQSAKCLHTYSPMTETPFSRLMLQPTSRTAMRLMQRALLVKLAPAARRTETLWATCTARREALTAVVADPPASKRLNVLSALLWRVARPRLSLRPISFAHCITRKHPFAASHCVSHGSPPRCLPLSFVEAYGGKYGPRRGTPLVASLRATRTPARA